MLVTYYYDKKNPEKLPHNDPQYGEPSPLQTMDLREMLANCFNISEDVEKGHAGQLYPFIADKFYKKEYIKENNIQTDGACLCDIDNLTKEQSDIIFNSFDVLCEYLPNLYTVWKSYSGVNLHFVFHTESLNTEEYYKQEILSLLFLSTYIHTKLGILLSDIKDTGNIDTHNSSISQRFWLNRISKDSIKINNYCSVANFQEPSKEQLSKLKELFPRITNIYLSSNTKILSTVNLDLLSGDVNKEKICIDRNFFIGNDNGNDVRWKISRIAQAIFGEVGAKEWCDRYFYCKDGSIYTHQNSIENLSLPIKNWLEEQGYLTSSKPNVIKRNEWITKYSEKIIDFIEKNHRCEIVAPTGVGKTSFINGCIDSTSIFSDEFSLAKKLNAVVIVPFNVTNRLYDNMLEVSSERKNDIKENAPVVMIWDQALLHWEQIKNRTLIIDESHCLFLDRRYRDTAVKLMKKIKEDDCKCILFTATPSGEAEELDCKTLQFKNERDIIDITFNKVNTVDMAQYNIIKYCLQNNNFDKIVLFDDMNAKKIWEKLIVDGTYINDIAYIRADTKNSEDFIKLREEELLTKKLTICTCVAFNGLNFKNENENILVVTSYRNGNTTAAEIIQEAGRIRKSKVNVVVYYDDKSSESTLEERIEKANVYQNAVVELGIPDSVLSYDRRLNNIDVVEALRRIEKHLLEESVKDKIIERLNECGYFMIKDKDNSNNEEQKGNKLNLALKSKESKEFIEDLMNDCIGEYKPDSYKDRWKNRIDSIINNDGYTGIDIDIFKEFIEKKNKKTLIETVISNIEKIIKITLISDTEWNKYVNNIDELKLRLTNDLDKRDLIRNYKKNIEIRNKYSNKVQLVEDNKYDLTNVFGDLFEELEASYNNERNIKSAAGKKSKRTGKPVMINGIEYESPKIAAQILNKSLAWISKYKDK